MKTERTERPNRRGSVLLHVLVTSVLVAIISATLLRMSMFRYQMAGRGALVLQEKRDDTGAMASVIGVWNAANKVCSGAPAGWAVLVGGVPGTCACSYRRNASVGPPVIDQVTVTAGGVPCTVTLSTLDLNP